MPRLPFPASPSHSGWFLALRGHQVAETESAAEAATERMTIPVAVLLFGFLVFIAYPAVQQITSVSSHPLP